jgi:CheY-like chemotaxis protein
MAHISEPGGPLLAAVIRDLTILLVEDHVQAREAMQLLLESLGARVVAAEDGRDALDRLAVVYPDLVLTDLAMPSLGGRELLHRLRADPAYQSVPVVAVSGWPSAFGEGPSAAFDGHLEKPFSLRSLADMLCQVICGHPQVFHRQRRRLCSRAAREREHSRLLRENSARVMRQAAEARVRGHALLAAAR